VGKYSAKYGRESGKQEVLKVSRIGRLPITVPAGIQVKVNGSAVEIQGPKGTMKRNFSPDMKIVFENGQILVSRNSEETPFRALHGTTRAILQNMVTGVHTGFTRILEIDGVGYRAEMEGKNVMFFVGFSHPVKVEPQEGITFDVDAKTRQVKVMGANKELVGQVAADLRKIRPPEPYKGKGIHYLGEKLRHKPGESAKTKGATA
jgi:large subunit ribosomal protein L6